MSSARRRDTDPRTLLTMRAAPIQWERTGKILAVSAASLPSFRLGIAGLTDSFHRAAAVRWRQTLDNEQPEPSHDPRIVWRCGASSKASGQNFENRHGRGRLEP